MDEVRSPYGIGALLMEITGELLQAFRDIGSHIALLLDILRAPTKILTFAIQLFPFQLHCSS